MILQNPNFIKPLYDSRCFADIPQTIKYLLTGQGCSLLATDVFGGLPQKYDTVIFFFIDAFGWRFFEKYRDNSPFLEHLIKDGVVSQLTSQFPSTTAAHVTCIHTGLPVGQSGIYEWYFYEPKVDAIIAPLLFSFAGATGRETLKLTGIAPEQFYPTQTIYQDLQQHGVTSYVLQHQEITPSTYSDIALQGAKVIPYKTLAEALVNLRLLLTQEDSAAYFFLYFDRIDATCHRYGPNSPQLEAEIDTFLTIMDRLFLQPLKGKLKNTLFIMTADHGQVEVYPQTTIYLNLAPRFSGMRRYLKTNRNGEPLVPAGSSRDLFLHIKDGLLDKAQEFLADRLIDKAAVYKVEPLIEQGFFGLQPVSHTFLSRIGNLVILPYRNESVWWYEKGKFEQTFYGHHGGLTSQEMEIPLAVYDFST